MSGASSVLGGLTGLGGLMSSWKSLFSGSGPSYMPNDTFGQPTGNLPLPKVNGSGIGSY